MKRLAALALLILSSCSDGASPRMVVYMPFYVAPMSQPQSMPQPLWVTGPLTNLPMANAYRGPWW